MKPRLLFLKLFALVACLSSALGTAAAEAYACYTSSNTTLTFYYDNQRSSRTGTTYDLNTDDNSTGWESDGTNASVTKVVFDSSFAGARPTTTSGWFYGMWKLESMTGMSYLNTSEVTNMSWMFNNCSILTSLDVSHFNTSKVTDMQSMFYNCESLTSLDVSQFNTSEVTDMRYMFYNCRTLTSLDLSHFNTSEVTNMGHMFNSCIKLTSLDLSSFNTSKVTHMNQMFQSCYKLTSLDLSHFNTSKVTDMGWMFDGCTNLRTIYVGNGWSTAAVTTSARMFWNCTSLVGGKGTTYDENYVDKTYAHIDGGPSNPGYFTRIEAYACYTPSNTTLTFYYDSQRSSRTGTTYDLNTGDSDTGWDTDGTNASVTKVVFDPSFASARPTTTCDWFHNMKNLESITGMEYLNTSEVTNMNWMFLKCSKLTSVDVSHFNTSKVTSMYSMFNSCTGLTSLDLSSFNTSKVAVMYRMFYNSTNLRTIYVGNGWSTAAVYGSTEMFKDCTSLVGGQGTTYNANHIDKTYAHIDGGTSNPGYFTEIPPEAYACYTESNTTLTFYYDGIRGSRTGTTYDLTLPDGLWPGWYFDYDMQAAVTRVVFDLSFSNVRPQTTYAWFSGMSNLTTITGMKEYLNTSEVTNMNIMFSGCSSLTSLDVSGFNTGNVEYMASMFAYCSSLTNLDLSNFNTSQVQFMNYMFSYCRKLKSVNLSSFNTANVLEMSGMFTECNELASVDLTSFNTARVTNMHNMFLYCSNLTSLDVSGFNTANVTDMQDMFAVCPNLTTIYVGDEWSTAAVTPSTSMFYRSTSLVGGMGTTYDASHVDATYAHIDGGLSNPGYFTDKNAALRGDVNGDGSINIDDVTALIDYLLGGNASGINLAGADCDQSGNVSIDDVTGLIDYLLGGAWN